MTLNHEVNVPDNDMAGGGFSTTNSLDLPVTKEQLGLDIGRSFIRYIGEDHQREGLVSTPKRYAKAIDDLCSGYSITLENAVGSGVFTAESRGLIRVDDVEFYSLCEHHLLPFWGKACVAYLPSRKILGLSKIPRIIDMYARRLQNQERLTQQIADAIGECIAPRAVRVTLNAQHLCMMSRGIKKQCSYTTTEVVTGLDLLEPFEKSQLMALSYS